MLLVIMAGGGIFGANALMGMMIGAFSGYISMMYFDRSRREASDF